MFVSPESSPGRNFYPRPPRGGRRSPTVFGWGVFLFLSTPSARRATPMSRSICARRSKFLSTPSARRATLYNHRHAHCCQISIHALREEGDQQAAPVVSTADKFLSTPSARRATIPSRQGLQGQGISIHALREEGDAAVNDLLQRHNISIHALREEGDPFRHRSERVKEDFYPRPPRGGRHQTTLTAEMYRKFLSTPSARRATGQGKRV